MLQRTFFKNFKGLFFEELLLNSLIHIFCETFTVYAAHAVQALKRKMKPNLKHSSLMLRICLSVMMIYEIIPNFTGVMRGQD